MTIYKRHEYKKKAKRLKEAIRNQEEAWYYAPIWWALYLRWQWWFFQLERCESKSWGHWQNSSPLTPEQRERIKGYQNRGRQLEVHLQFLEGKVKDYADARFVSFYGACVAARRAGAWNNPLLEHSGKQPSTNIVEPRLKGWSTQCIQWVKRQGVGLAYRVWFKSTKTLRSPLTLNSTLDLAPKQRQVESRMKKPSNPHGFPEIVAYPENIKRHMESLAKNPGKITNEQSDDPEMQEFIAWRLRQVSQ